MFGSLSMEAAFRRVSTDFTFISTATSAQVGTPATMACMHARIADAVVPFVGAAPLSRVCYIWRCPPVVLLLAVSIVPSCCACNMGRLLSTGLQSLPCPPRICVYHPVAIMHRMFFAIALTPLSLVFPLSSFVSFSPGCAAAGGHFNPDSVNHGGPDSPVRYAHYEICTEDIVLCISNTELIARDDPEVYTSILVTINLVARGRHVTHPLVPSLADTLVTWATLRRTAMVWLPSAATIPACSSAAIGPS